MNEYRTTKRYCEDSLTEFREAGVQQAQKIIEELLDNDTQYTDALKEEKSIK
jgi:broad specificity phosphatase PhoE